MSKVARVQELIDVETEASHRALSMVLLSWRAMKPLLHAWNGWQNIYTF